MAWSWSGNGSFQSELGMGADVNNARWVLIRERTIIRGWNRRIVFMRDSWRPSVLTRLNVTMMKCNEAAWGNISNGTKKVEMNARYDNILYNQIDRHLCIIS